MNFQFLHIRFAKKNTLMKKLRDILQMPQFCDRQVIYFNLIARLLKTLEDNIAFVIEYPYVDRHYRDSYYYYHSTKFKEFSRNCIRVHLFIDSSFNDVDALINMPDSEKQKYAGFFIVRPLPQFPLGRSLLAPPAFKNHNFVCCLMKSKVTLLGVELKAYGFPHVAQDTETHTCAESLLWSFFEYLGSRYIQYRPLLLSQILHNLSGISDRRLLPSTGLYDNEISKCLHVNGCECIIEYPENSSKIDDFRFFLFKIYIESGIPIYITLEDGTSGHAVLAIGHENMDEYGIPQKGWNDISEYPKNIVFIDDNIPSYQTGKLDAPISYNSEYKIKTYFVPLPRHTNLDARTAFLLAKETFNSLEVGLVNFGEQWLTRLFLTGSHSFKKFILERGNLDENIKRVLLRMAFPRFIWICEIYRPEEFQREYCSGLLIIDATGANSLTSILWYNVGDKMIEHDGLGWNGINPIKPFKMATYRHNLKGEWNKWRI